MADDSTSTAPAAGSGGEVTVVAVLTAADGQADTVGAALARLAAASRQEPGCQFYVVSRSLDDPSVFTTMERWSSRGALDAHFVAPAMAAAGDGLAALAAPPQIVIGSELPVD